MDVDANGKVANEYINPRRKKVPLPDAKASDYLVGSQLDEALVAGENIEVYWPLEGDDDIQCWPQVEALWCVTSMFRQTFLTPPQEIRALQSPWPPAQTK